SRASGRLGRPAGWRRSHHLQPHTRAGRDARGRPLRADGLEPGPHHAGPPRPGRPPPPLPPHPPPPPPPPPPTPPPPPRAPPRTPSSTRATHPIPPPPATPPTTSTSSSPAPAWRAARGLSGRPLMSLQSPFPAINGPPPSRPSTRPWRPPS